MALLIASVVLPALPDIAFELCPVVIKAKFSIVDWSCISPFIFLLTESMPAEKSANTEAKFAVLITARSLAIPDKVEPTRAKVANYAINEAIPSKANGLPSIVIAAPSAATPPANA